MGDSTNWSSFEDDTPPRKKPAPPQSKPKTPLTTTAADADATSTGVSGVTTTLGIKPMDLRNLRNRLMFGGLVGFCTGATFGTIDAIKVYSKVHGRMGLSAINSVARGAGVSGGAFAGFFFAYQGVKTIMEVQRGEEDFMNVGVATLVGAAPFMGSTILRQNIPYALMLIALDVFHEEINEARR